MEPGKSHSRFDDAATLGLKDKIFGAQSEAAVANAASLINLPKTTLVQDIKMGKAEQIYYSVKREPLGRSVNRNYNLPEKCATEAFGVKSVSSLEPAKGIIFPDVREDVNAGTELYKVSHGSYGPGEQKSRHYNVPLQEMTFGVKGTSVAFNGVSQNVDDVLKSVGETSGVVDTAAVEAFRKRQDQLGHSRHLGQDSDKRGLDFVYGKGRKGQNFGAAEVLRGKYTAEQQLADPDLGKSITPGFRNIQAPGRSYGCPSIRNDIPKVTIAKRSIADSQNYGDDATAAELINPHQYSSLTIDSSAMDELKPKASVVSVFKKIGYAHIHDDILSAVFDEAASSQSPAGTHCSVNAFRNILNQYLESIEMGTEEQWLADHGL
jgi:EF-hand domain-containing family member B